MRDYEELVRCLRGHSQKMGCADNCICEDADERGFGTCSEELAKLAADAIDELCKPKWISVDERLPEDREFVLFWLPRVNSCVTGNVSTDGVRLDEYGVVRKTSLLYPSHWMPLPEPPKESINDSR